MLARPHTISLEDAQHLAGDIYVQPKLDGIRAFWDTESRTLTGKDGQPFDLPAVIDKLIENHTPSIDGELWNVGMDFGAVLSDYRLGGCNLNLHAFDMPLPRSQAHRLDQLCSNGCIPHMVPCSVIKADLIERVHREHLSRGYEGTILRLPNRSFSGDGIFKIKPHLDFEARLVSYDGLSGSFEPLPNPSGQSATAPFKCRIAGGIFPDDIVTIKCDSITKAGKPRFPRIK